MGCFFFLVNPQEKEKRMLEHYFARTSVVARYRFGPLAPYLDDFATTLQQQGYKPDNLRVFLRACGHLSQWLSAQEKTVTVLMTPSSHALPAASNGRLQADGPKPP